MEGCLPGKDDTRAPELQKLEEKLRKDPASKLFFPLAEEYAKIGRLDEAIALLRTGVKAHPDFLGARVALGKVLLTKGQTAEAKKEFEQVVAANPDNLMAHKKLAAIYFKDQDRDKALASCEIVLAVSRTDPEALKLREEISRLPVPSAEEEPTELARPATLDPPEAEPTVVEAIRPAEEDVEATVTMVEPTVVERTVVEPPAEPTVVESIPAEPEVAEVTEAIELPREAPMFPDLEAAPDRSAGNEMGDEDLATLSLADLYVAQGHYDRGIAIYRRLLERTPGDADLSAKLDNALTLERLLAPQAVDAEVVKSEVVSQVLSRGEEPEIESLGEASHPPLVGVAANVARNQAAIRRLEVWLTRITERRRR
ncbi:MAG TPA: tetratricopeptide repeat protein [Nitrospiria bacterium]|nr:tetratricopeptide repeat protein [Nitrospiria bacterium]